MLEKTLESPVNSKEIIQSILKEINPEYSLEGLILRLKLPYFGHLMQRIDSLEKTLILGGASLIAQMVKNLPIMQETWVQCLGQENPLEKKRATDSSFLAWRIPWTEEPGELQSMGSQRIGHD